MFAVRKSTGPPRLYTSPRIPYRRQSFVKFFLKKLPLIVFEWQSMQELKEKKRKKKEEKEEEGKENHANRTSIFFKILLEQGRGSNF